MKKLMTGLFALTLMLGFAVNAQAQSDEADITARANVLVDVTVNANGDLVFGNVSPGIAKTVSNISAVSGSSATGGEQAGGFTIGKGADSFVTLTFALPSNLVSDESINLPISFANTDARITTANERTEAGANSIDFDPNAANNLENLDGADRTTYFEATEFFVFLGGTVAPTATQAAGAYEGTVTLTVSYN